MSNGMCPRCQYPLVAMPGEIECCCPASEADRTIARLQVDLQGAANDVARYHERAVKAEEQVKQLRGVLIGMLSANDPRRLHGDYDRSLRAAEKAQAVLEAVDAKRSDDVYQTFADQALAKMPLQQADPFSRVPGAMTFRDPEAPEKPLGPDLK